MQPEHNQTFGSLCDTVYVCVIVRVCVCTHICVLPSDLIAWKFVEVI